MILNYFKKSLTGRAKIIDGKLIAKYLTSIFLIKYKKKFILSNVLQEYKPKIEKLTNDYGIRPGFAIIQVTSKNT